MLYHIIEQSIFTREFMVQEVCLQNVYSYVPTCYDTNKEEYNTWYPTHRHLANLFT